MKYCRKFFATIDEAEQFKKERGNGALYQFAQKVKKGYGPNSYNVEASIAGMTMDERKKMPYCVAWNEKA